MRRLRTRLVNIGPHVDTEIFWPRGITALVAPNGTGKTFALEGIMGAEFGKFPYREAVGGIYERVRRGCEKGEVEEDIELPDGRILRTERFIDASTRTTKIHLHPLIFDQSTGAYTIPQTPDKDGKLKDVLLAGPLAKDFDPAIQKILGDETIALASWFSTQNGTGNLCLLSPPERRKAFARLIECEHLTETAKHFGAIANELKGSIKELSTILAADPDFETLIVEKRTASENQLAALGNTRNALAESETALAEVQQRLRDIAASEQVHRATIDRHETAQREASAIEGRIRTLIGEIEVLRGRFANIGQLRLDVEREGVVRQRIADLEFEMSAWNTARAREQRAEELRQQLAAARAQREAEEAKAGIQEGDEVLAALVDTCQTNIDLITKANDSATRANTDRANQRRRADLAIAALEPKAVIADADRTLAATVAAITEEYKAAKAKNETVLADNQELDGRRTECSRNIEDRKRDLARIETKLAELRRRAEKRPETPFGEACSTEKGGCAFLAEFKSIPVAVAEAEKEEARLKVTIAELERIHGEIPANGTPTDLSHIVERGAKAREAETRVSAANQAHNDLLRERTTRNAIPDDAPIADLSDLRSRLQTANEAAARVKKATAAREAIAEHERRIAVIQSDIETHGMLPPVAAPTTDPSPTLAEARGTLNTLAGAKDRLAAAEQAERDANAKEVALSQEESARAIAQCTVTTLQREADAAREALTATADMATLKSEASYHTERIGEHRAAIDAGIAAKARLEHELESLRTRKAESDERRERVAVLEKRTEALANLRKCFIGVQPILIDAQAEFLALEVDRTLRQVTDGAFGFRILTQSATQTGDIKEDFIFEISTRKGRFDVLECSGGEGAIVRIVIAQGIGKWQARLKGLAAPGCICLDETLSQLDPENLERVLAMLLRIGEQFEQIILVSHTDALNAAIAQQVQLSPTAAGVKVAYRGIGARPYARVGNDGGITEDMFTTQGADE